MTSFRRSPARKAVVVRSGAGKLPARVEHPREQIKRQQPTVGADRLEVLVAPGHAWFSYGNRTQARSALYDRAGVNPNEG